MIVRPRIRGILEPIGRFFHRFGVTPTVMTLLGLFITLIGAVVIGSGRLTLGASIAILGSALDGLDGAVARAAGLVSARGAFLDAGSDRTGEIATYAGLAVAMMGDTTALVLIVISLGGAMLTPYLRAKAESVGLTGRTGYVGRAERVIVFTIGLLTGYVVPMLWVMAIATWVTSIHRFFVAYHAIEP